MTASNSFILTQLEVDNASVLIFKSKKNQLPALNDI